MLDCRYFLFLLFVTWMHFKRSLPEGLGDPITYLNLHLCGTLHENALYLEFNLLRQKSHLFLSRS